MNLSQNKTLTPQDEKHYNNLRNINISLSTVGIVIILAFFDKLPIVFSAFSLIVAISGYFTWQQVKYEQGKDLKMNLLFIGLSAVIALALWLSFLFT